VPEANAVPHDAPHEPGFAHPEPIRVQIRAQLRLRCADWQRPRADQLHPKPCESFGRCWLAAGAWRARWWGDCCWPACSIASSPPISTRPAPRVALRTSPASVAQPGERRRPLGPPPFSPRPMQQETLANVFRSDQLAWKVITGLKLYQAPGFMGRFAQQAFSGFSPRNSVARCSGLAAQEISAGGLRCAGDRAAHAADSRFASAAGRGPLGQRGERADSRLWPAGQRIAGRRPRSAGLGLAAEASSSDLKAQVDQGPAATGESFQQSARPAEHSGDSGQRPAQRRPSTRWP
jgi:hypothetical protein